MTIEPKLAKRASWASILCSFVLSAETWVKLAEMAGFTGTMKLPVTLPIIGDTLRTSWAMVGVVDAYVISALVLWTFTTNKELASFARKNTYAAALVGVAAQAGYHGWQAWDRRAAVVVIILSIIVGALPPLFAAVGIHMRSIGLLAARTGQDSDKLTAGLLSLSLIHAAADTTLTVTSQLRVRVAELESALAATEQVLEAVTVAPVRESRPISAPPVDSESAVRSEPTVTVKPRRASSKVQREALAWLADNAGDSAPGVLAQKLMERYGVSEATAYRYAKAYRESARGGE